MFGKVVKKTVADQVIDQIKSLLSGGDLRPGSQLPPERQLAEMLGVSRPSLREALRALEYAGVLETRVGEGVFVSDGSCMLSNNLQMSHLLQQYALEEMIEVRKVLETASIKLAVERASDEDIACIRKVHEESKAELHSREGFAHSDYAFHQAIVEAAHNSIFVVMLQTMRQMMSDFNIELLATVKGRRAVIQNHEEVLEALASRESKAAAKALESHLDNVVFSMKAQTRA
ncbi:FadR family transcriptional regulator [Desulfovibrio sp. OttesenSCG-928-I05]|nr:FadR family transcriptional regulator [Desulfovibrio sp. OttesenSCG-928-I05]